MTTATSSWQLARRAERMNPSVIREILTVTEKPGIISFAGGLPASKTFPVAEFEAACAKLLTDDPAGALQYAASEGYGPLRDMVAKVLIDADSKILVESPTDLGAVMAFVPGAPFYADHGDARTLRLSFVTPSVDEIHRGVAALAVTLKIYAASLAA